MAERRLREGDAANSASSAGWSGVMVMMIKMMVIMIKMGRGDDQDDNEDGDNNVDVDHQVDAGTGPHLLCGRDSWPCCRHRHPQEEHQVHHPYQPCHSHRDWL